MGDEKILRLIGVYNAEGTLRGELTYWIGARLGSAHCALCDITHGLFRERSDWKTCRDGLPFPFESYHLDDQPDQVRPSTLGAGAPLVAAETGSGVVVLLGPAALEECGGSGEQMVAALLARASELGLTWS